MNTNKRPVFTIRLALVVCLFTMLMTSTAAYSNSDNPISGKIINGFRVLLIENTTETINLTVYRGDYIRFEFDDSIISPLLSIPDLSIRQNIPGRPDNAPYLKMNTEGTFDFSLGAVKGKIHVIEYKHAAYTEVTAEQAIQIIKNRNPFILDVRTPMEFKKGHLKNAVLIPIQELDKHIDKIAPYKNKELLLYCATGNRSTVAAKILIEKGFKQITNMRYGIVDWEKRRYPVSR